MLFWALSGSLIRPTFTALISRAAPAEIRGALFGINDSLSNLAFIIAPIAATLVLTKNVHAVGILPVVGTLAALAIGFRLLTGSKAALSA